MILIGNWGSDRADKDSFYAANSALTRAGGKGDLQMLIKARDLADAGSTSFISSGSPPDEGFRERYQNSAQYAPPPNLLATLTYDIARLALATWSSGKSIGEAEYQGLNGRIRFEDGYWAGAPIRRYRYEDGELIVEVD